FGHQTLRDNVALLDDQVLQAINARIAAAGREVFAKKAGAPLAALEIKIDSYVLESDVHFPTDLSLLWDAGRKCVDLVEGLLASSYTLPGWRKFKAWRRQLKNLERTASQVVYRGGANKEARVKAAVRAYLAVGGALSTKVRASLLELCDLSVAAARWERLAYFQTMLDKHLDLVQRRLLNEETIPAHEKVFSLFEPHTEWIQKGKQRPNVELGHKLLLATDQHQMIQDYDVLLKAAEVDQSVPVTDRLLGRYGAGGLASLSFDKGFTRTADRELLSLYVPEVVMPKRGKKNAAETERESGKKFVALRQQHSAVESEINSLEHHGLNRCWDVGLPGYLRYVGLGVMSYNLHVIGRELLARQRRRGDTLVLAA
ncbi:MAG TPA: ISNCY family transposase, partial [Candidatus Dormibacteraeota bacterium]|nr:ISNCY family transposase [Candidatus Dormibacteraeota bacterium]